MNDMMQDVPTWRVRLMLLRWWLAEKREDLVMWLAWHLPRSLAYWATVRLISHAGQKMSTKELEAITPAEVLTAWKDD